jgi:hypothetical protein
MTPAGRFGGQGCQQAPDEPDLVVVDQVAHAGIDALGDESAEPAQNRRGLADPSERNVRVDVAAAQEGGGAGERARIVARVPSGPISPPLSPITPP